VTGRGGVRGDEDEPGPKYTMGGERGMVWPSYGDEGGGGLLWAPPELAR